MLIKSKASVNAQNFVGDTPLHVALKYGDKGYVMQVCEVLLAAGASTEIRNNHHLKPADVTENRRVQDFLTHYFPGATEQDMFCRMHATPAVITSLVDALHTKWLEYTKLGYIYIYIFIFIS